MKDFERRLDFKLPPGQSAFLWGARKTGKSTWLRQRFPDSPYFDLLKTDLMLDFMRRPALLREQILAMNLSRIDGPIILDEVQKVPQLLDEVQWLIETQRLGFLLCGSSARKLKRGQSNLLGGRAWRFEMHPLTFTEVPGFNLLQAMNRGLLPSHYTQQQYRTRLRCRCQDGQGVLSDSGRYATGLIRRTVQAPPVKAGDFQGCQVLPV
jgi:predicted AAA+ superfamily ATPase